MTETKTFVFPKADGLNLKGSRPNSGNMKVNIDGKIAIAISNGKYCVKKGYNDTDVIIDENIEDCIMPMAIEDLEVEDSIILETNEEKIVSVNILPTDATDRSLVWKSNNENVVTVDENGKLKGVKKGTAEVIVSAKNNSNISKTINVTVNSIITTRDACLTNGTCASGTKLNVKVNLNENHDFYVIKDENNELTLIMDRNLGNWLLAWCSKEDYIAAGGTEDEYENAGSNKGPLTALRVLRIRVLEWINIPIMTYTLEDDRPGLWGDEVKYQPIEVTDTRARLLTATEAVSLGCSTETGSCPAWLYENLSKTGETGYWLSTAYSGYKAGAHLIGYKLRNVGYSTVSSEYYTYNYNVRPVIKIAKDS